MSEIIEKTWTALELRNELRKIAALLKPKACLFMGVAVGEYSSPQPTLSIYPNDIIDGGKHEFFKGSTFDEVLAAGMAWTKAYAPTPHNALIRRMALAIIEITDEHGECTSALLRAKTFSADEIKRHHAEACVRAGEMAGNAPFSVIGAE